MKLFIIAVLAILLLLFVLYTYKYIRHKYHAVQIITLESFLNAHPISEQESSASKSLVEKINDFFDGSGGMDTGDSDDRGDDGGE
ncbi:hypothetical protein ACOJQI_00080 [Bacillus salacetis]|uniref:hypothetical protein n=1 Tax=Bacillus salacetis TaxID=2315464 RepID=UPI003BA29E8C